MPFEINGLIDQIKQRRQSSLDSTREVTVNHFGDRIREELNRRLQALGDDGYKKPTQLGMNILSELKTLNDNTYPMWGTIGNNLASMQKNLRRGLEVAELIAVPTADKWKYRLVITPVSQVWLRRQSRSHLLQRSEPSS